MDGRTKKESKTSQLTYIILSPAAAFVEIQQCEFAEAQCRPQNLHLTTRAHPIFTSVFNVLTSKNIKDKKVCLHNIHFSILLLVYQLGFYHLCQ